MRVVAQCCTKDVFVEMRANDILHHYYRARKRAININQIISKSCHTHVRTEHCDKKEKQNKSNMEYILCTLK